MSYELIVRNRAEKEFEKVMYEYKLISKDVSSRFFIELENALNRITKNPKAFQIRYKNMRMIHLPTFPFSLHFKINLTKKTVRVFALSPSKSNPVNWLQ